MIRTCINGISEGVAGSENPHWTWDQFLGCFLLGVLGHEPFLLGAQAVYMYFSVLAGQTLTVLAGVDSLSLRGIIFPLNQFALLFRLSTDAFCHVDVTSAGRSSPSNHRHQQAVAMLCYMCKHTYSQFCTCK